MIVIFVMCKSLCSDTTESYAETDVADKYKITVEKRQPIVSSAPHHLRRTLIMIFHEIISLRLPKQLCVLQIIESVKFVVI